MNQKFLSIVSVVVGFVVIWDTVKEGTLELPSWLWYAIGGSLVLFGSLTLFEVYKLKARA